MIELSVNETKWCSLLASTPAFILYISIWIFDFGPVKLPGRSRNGPQSSYFYFCFAKIDGSSQYLNFEKFCAKMQYACTRCGARITHKNCGYARLRTTANFITKSRLWTKVLAFALLCSYSLWKYIYKQLCKIKFSKRARTWIERSFPGFKVRHTEKILLLTTFSNVSKNLFQR